MKNEYREKLTAAVTDFVKQRHEARKNMDWCEVRIKQLERVLDANPAFHSLALVRPGQNKCQMVNSVSGHIWKHEDVPFATSMIFTKENIYIRVSDEGFMLLGEIG